MKKESDIDENGNLEALQPGDVTIQGIIPGLAADKGFLFIDALGRVGAFDDDGAIHWDIVTMVLIFGITTLLSVSCFLDKIPVMLILSKKQ